MLAELLKDKHIILASKSPRRKELLAGLNIDFTTKTKEVDESFSDDLDTFKVAEFLAHKKALGFDEDLKQNEIVITSDTVVICDGEILGKPKSKIQAFNMLSKLSGKKHAVVTGVCLMSLEKTVVFSDVTNVWFKELSCDEMNYYIKNYKPFDKAGSYGIQEWIGYIGIEKIEGTYFNVMGLPVNLVAKNLLQFV